jgi:hypothetical protein
MVSKRHYLLFALAVCLAGCATGSAIVTGAAKAPIAPEQVTLYLEPPAEFEPIGLLNASSPMSFSKQETVNMAVKELKAQAAKIGANGVLLISSGEGADGTTMEVQGKAIYVRPK